MRGQIVWKMRRYKYPTINTDTYTLNEVDGRLGGGEEENIGGKKEIDGKRKGGEGEYRKGMIDQKKEEYSIRYNNSNV